MGARGTAGIATGDVLAGRTAGVARAGLIGGAAAVTATVGARRTAVPAATDRVGRTAGVVAALVVGRRIAAGVATAQRAGDALLALAVADLPVRTTPATAAAAVVAALFALTLRRALTPPVLTARLRPGTVHAGRSVRATGLLGIPRLAGAVAATPGRTGLRRARRGLALAALLVAGLPGRTGATTAAAAVRAALLALAVRHALTPPVLTDRLRSRTIHAGRPVRATGLLGIARLAGPVRRTTPGRTGLRGSRPAVPDICRWGRTFGRAHSSRRYPYCRSRRRRIPARRSSAHSTTRAGRRSCCIDWPGVGNSPPPRSSRCCRVGRSLPRTAWVARRSSWLKQVALTAVAVWLAGAAGGLAGCRVDDGQRWGWRWRGRALATPARGGLGWCCCACSCSVPMPLVAAACLLRCFLLCCLRVRRLAAASSSPRVLSTPPRGRAVSSPSSRRRVLPVAKERTRRSKASGVHGQPSFASRGSAGGPRGPPAGRSTAQAGRARSAIAAPATCEQRHAGWRAV